MENLEESEGFDGWRRKRTMTKDEALYGVFAAESSDSDHDISESRKKRRKNGDVINRSDFTKPVNFVSTGVSTDKKPEEDSDQIPAEILPGKFGKRRNQGAEKRVKEVGRMDHDQPGDFGAFEMHTKGIGLKLMQGWGFKKGCGLGKNGEGIVAPVEVELRPKNEGLGFSTKPAPKKRQEEEIPVARARVEQDHVKETPSWSKKAPPPPPKKKSYVITADELLQRKQEQNLERVYKVLDMRGPQVRLTSLENAVARDESDDDAPMPELQYNMNLFMDLTELDVQNIDRELANERETFASLQREKDKIQNDLLQKERKLDNMRTIASIIKRVEEESSMGILNLETLAEPFSDMITDYGDDYKLYNLSSIACSYALPLFIREFRGWNLLENPRHGIDAVSLWKSVLSTDIYAQLIMEVVLPAVRASGTNIWRERDREPMLKFVEFLDSWEALLTPGVVQFILDNVILPNLSAAVESWEPRQGTEILIHKWVHPWLPRLHEKLGPCYETICQKLGRFLRDNWDPKDRSVYEHLVETWKPVFDAATWDKLTLDSIAPTLLTFMKGLEINPKDEHKSTDDFSCIMIWASAIPYQKMIDIMELFFAKWLRILHQWLNSPELNRVEVREWFLGWKRLIPDELLAYERVRFRINEAVVMMHQSAQGKKVVLPERLSDQKQEKVEERRFYEKAAPRVLHQSEEGAEIMSFKQAVEKCAALNGLLLQPKPGRMHDGHQIYGFGSISIVIDNHNERLSALMDDGIWKPVNLEKLKELAVLRKH